MARSDDITSNRRFDAQELHDRMENMSNEGHGFPRPIRDADSAMVECAKLLRLLTGLLQQFAAGSICGRLDVRWWPLGVDFRIEVRK